MQPRTVFARIAVALSLLTLTAVPSARAQLSPAPATTPQTTPTPATLTPGSLFNPLAAPPSSASLLTQPTLSPGALLLFSLERRFATDVSAGGGKAFASWFAPDAVMLANSQPPLLGRSAIAASANWDPKTYQLTWTPTAAEMGPSDDMGFTWGHYEGRSRDAHGQPITVTGRYITVWKKEPNGEWKVALDASAQEPPAAGDCCALPKP